MYSRNSVETNSINGTVGGREYKAEESLMSLFSPHSPHPTEHKVENGSSANTQLFMQRYFRSMNAIGQDDPSSVVGQAEKRGHGASWRK